MPRVGAAYDLFGDGKTGLKGSVGRYMQQDATAYPQTYNPMAHGHREPLVDRPEQATTIAQGELGCVYLTRRLRDQFRAVADAPSVRAATGIRTRISRGRTRWSTTPASRMNCVPASALAFNYYRREFHDVTYTTNLVEPDQRLHAVPASRIRAATARSRSTTSDPAKLAPINELDTTSANNKTTFNGFDVGVNARFGNGAHRSPADRRPDERCGAVRPVDPTTSRNSARPPVLRSERARHAVADDRQVLGQRTRWVRLPVERRVPELARGRGHPHLCGDGGELPDAVPACRWAQSSVTMRLNSPATEYLPRVNQLDMTFSKTFKVGKARVSPEVSLFNMLNANPVLSQTTAYPALGMPLRILDGRLIRFQVQVRF